MKMKYVLCGAIVLAVGVGIAYVLHHKNDKEIIRDVDNQSEPDLTKVQNDIIVAEQETAKERAETINAISDRHKEATKIMKESLENIVSTDNLVETENTETLDSIMDDIDKLMS